MTRNTRTGLSALPATPDDAGGIWKWTGENARPYRVDRDLLKMLDGLGYRFFDDHANVYSVENATERPTVDPACISVSVDGVQIFSDAPGILATGHVPALDICGGHAGPGGWYHWHATSTDVATVFATGNVDADCALSQNADEDGRNEPPRPGGGETGGTPPDLEAAAEALGVVPQALTRALGVTEEALRGALPPAPTRQVPRLPDRSPT